MFDTVRIFVGHAAFLLIFFLHISQITHPLSEVTNILYLLALVILTSFLICSHWLTQSQKEADIYYLFIIG